jgi:hypothetical protein
VNPVSDVVVAIVTALAVPVFGSDPTIMNILFRCKRDTGSSGAVSSQHAVSISLSQQTHIQRDPSSTRLEHFGSSGLEGNWKGFVAAGADDAVLPKTGKHNMQDDIALSVYDGSNKS